MATVDAAEENRGANAKRSNEARLDNPSGLAVPRYVSLKADKVNVHSGPGTQYPLTWIFQQAGLPVEVIQELDVWRRVRDSEGATGWVFHALLSGRRTVLVLPWEVKKSEPQSPVSASAGVEVHASDTATSAIAAVVEPGVIGNVRSCEAQWCLITIGPHKGYVQQNKLWGVYPGEIIK